MIDVLKINDAVKFTINGNEEISYPLNEIYFTVNNDTEIITFKNINSDRIIVNELIDNITVESNPTNKDSIIQDLNPILYKIGGGGSDVDLSNYYTKDETDALLDLKVNEEDLDNYYTINETDNLMDKKANLYPIIGNKSISLADIVVGDDLSNCKLIFDNNNPPQGYTGSNRYIVTNGGYYLFFGYGNFGPGYCLIKGSMVGIGTIIKKFANSTGNYLIPEYDLPADMGTVTEIDMGDNSDLSSKVFYSTQAINVTGVKYIDVEDVYKLITSINNTNYVGKCPISAINIDTDKFDIIDGTDNEGVTFNIYRNGNVVNITTSIKTKIKIPWGDIPVLINAIPEGYRPLSTVRYTNDYQDITTGDETYHITISSNGDMFLKNSATATYQIQSGAILNMNISYITKDEFPIADII